MEEELLQALLGITIGISLGQLGIFLVERFFK